MPSRSRSATTPVRRAPGDRHVSASGILASDGERRVSDLAWRDRGSARTGSALGEASAYALRSACPPDGRHVASPPDRRRARTDVWLLRPGRGALARHHLRAGDDEPRRGLRTAAGSPSARDRDRELSAPVLTRARTAERSRARSRRARRHRSLATWTGARPVRLGDHAYGDGATRAAIDLARPRDRRAASRARRRRGSTRPTAAISPDGRWLAYASNETGRDEVYVAPFPEPGRSVAGLDDGGHQPRLEPGRSRALLPRRPTAD